MFVATASDRTVRAYDRDSGKVVWTKDLPTGSEGVPATYRSGRPSVHRVPSGGRRRFVPSALWRPSTCAGGGDGAAAAGWWS